MLLSKNTLFSGKNKRVTLIFNRKNRVADVVLALFSHFQKRKPKRCLFLPHGTGNAPNRNFRPFG